MLICFFANEIYRYLFCCRSHCHRHLALHNFISLFISIYLRRASLLAQAKSIYYSDLQYFGMEM